MEQNPYPNRENDPAKAYEMAHAGNEDRTQAAQLRGFASTISEITYTPEILHNEHELREILDHPGLDVDKPGSKFGPPSINYFFTTRLDKGGLNIEMNEKVIKRVNEWSEGYDALALAKEEWTGVLYDQPPSDDYKDKFSDINFGADSLTEIENWCKDITEQRKVADELTPLLLLQQATGDNSVENLVNDDEEGEALIHAWEELCSNPDTSIGELANFYRDVYIKYKLDIHSRKLNRINGLMEDLRSGRAAEYKRKPATS